MLEKAGVCNHYESAALPTELRRPNNLRTTFVPNVPTAGKIGMSTDDVMPIFTRITFNQHQRKALRPSRAHHQTADVTLFEDAIMPEQQNYLHVVPTRKLERLRLKAAYEHTVTSLCVDRRVSVL